MNKRVGTALLAGLMVLLSGCGTKSSSPTSPESIAADTAEADSTLGGTEAQDTTPQETDAPEISADETVNGTEPAASNADTTDAAGTLLTGDGVFDIKKHAFSFENYGNEDGVSNLSNAEMVRMFGDSVCGGGTGPNCRLLPSARAWMERTNNAMDGGHCEGFATLSLLMEEGVVNPKDFGAANAAGLKIEGNTDLQREIAYWWATQDVPPTNGSQFVGKPSEIVAELRRWFDDPKKILGYTIGFYKEDHTGGHAVTPIALNDKGNGVVDIVIYDNNYPGQRRNIAVDTNAETWSYNGATIPTDAEGKYVGSAETKTLDLTPTETRIDVQDCPFCREGGDEPSGGKTGTTKAKRTMQVFFDDASFEAGVDLSITKIGGGELPGVIEDFVVGGELWNNDAPPSYRVPVNTPFQINIDASKAKASSNTSITIIGNGFTAGVSDMVVTQGETTIVEVDPVKKSVVYDTEQGESPDVFLGVDGTEDSYYLTLSGVDLGDNGGRIAALLDQKAKTLTAKITGSKETAILSLTMERINDAASESFTNDGLELAPNESVIIGYGAWKGNSDAADIGIDTNGDGVADKSIELPDES